SQLRPETRRRLGEERRDAYRLPPCLETLDADELLAAREVARADALEPYQHGNPRMRLSPGKEVDRARAEIPRDARLDADRPQLFLARIRWRRHRRPAQARRRVNGLMSTRLSP